MNDLIELIFSNFLIVAAIIGGIISWFSGMSKEESDKQDRAPKQPKPTKTPSGPMQHRPYAEKAEEVKSRTKEAAQETKGRVEEYYEQKKQRLEEMADYQDRRAQESLTFDQKDLNKDKMEVFVQDDSVERKSSLKYSTKFNRNRLAEGIVMSEILGQPRAYKPHSSHPRKR
ncbi:hypothetical protein [Halobacillus sp. Marseille-P3879]|uniref:hypothetical protein n=1 Tax=Halobacillus sp. Marseille-P3879 TaxID=2045014 RepID=UPI000C7C1B4D|nr:hypothetical protein [Halobacillus sp. Marseille-P3879]